MMQEHLHVFRALFNHHILRKVLEPAPLHRPQKDRRFVAAGVGEDRLPTWHEELRYQICECRCVLAFVEHVGGENEVESSDTLDLRRAPVEEGRIWLPAEVIAGIVGGEVEGGLVVVRRQYRRAAGERDDGG